MTHLAALLGVTAISFVPVFVRLTGLSPATVAFWRLAYALPALVAAFVVVRRRDHRPSGRDSRRAPPVWCSPSTSSAGTSRSLASGQAWPAW